MIGVDAVSGRLGMRRLMPGAPDLAAPPACAPLSASTPIMALQQHTIGRALLDLSQAAPVVRRGAEPQLAGVLNGQNMPADRRIAASDRSSPRSACRPSPAHWP